MNGLELAKEYFTACGLPMIKEQFPQYQERIAAGLAGEGSECFGYDDKISRDHDWGPSFCLWLTDEDFKEIGPELNKAYQKLPGEFMGFPRRENTELAGERVGAMPAAKFYLRYIGLSQAPRSLMEWRRIPESYLAVATNGEVFADQWGEFSKIRRELLKFYPEDIRIKKIVARAAIMAQAGQYNYPRCIKRGEYVAAQCALHEFIKATLSMVYILNRSYSPFYKWAHRGIRNLPILSETYDLFAALCRDYSGRDAYRFREEIIEAICVLVKNELVKQQLTDLDDDFLQNHCVGMMQRIRDDSIRGLHILAE